MRTTVRLLRIIGLLVLAVGLSACSAVKLGYGSAPQVVYWWLDGYLDFTDAQAPQVRDELDRLHRWHRSTELPKLAAGAMADGQVICAEAGGVEGEQKAGMDKFKADFKKKFGADVQIYAPYVYDATMVMVDAMVKAGSPEPAKYLPVLAKTSGYKGVTGTISFDEKGDVKNGALTLFTYKGEKREQIAVVR